MSELSDPLLDLVDRPPVKPVDAVPGVFIRETSLQDVMRYADRLKTAGDNVDRLAEASAFLIAASVCDGGGVLRYTPDHVAKLVNLPRSTTNAIVEAISANNGLRTKEVADAESKSETTASSASQ